jgi:dipeptidyl aminopeptidase/acylaminoacyl peptidase
MRARTYPASTLTQVRSDGDQGGYVNTVVSFVSDGLVEDSLMSVPDAPKPAAGWPVIIINHGYIDPTTYRTDDGSYAQFIAAFARAGYMVLKPDYRGHGQSQGVAEGGYVSPVYTYDVLNLVSTLRADARVDPTRIGLFGHSMGGQEALRAMVVSPDLKAVVFMAGAVGSFYDIFYNWPHPPRPTDSAQAVQVPLEEAVITRYGTPLDDPAFWNGASAINFVNATNAAVQINQDAGDSMVPATFADHLAAALHAAGKTYEYTTYPGDDHQFISNRAAILANTVAFYRAHL